MKTLKLVSVIVILQFAICQNLYSECINGNCSTGHGTYIWQSGDEYVGDFIDGKRTGHGTYTCSNGDEYVGDFRDDKLHGRGILTRSDYEYVGDFRDGKFHGRGTLTQSNGSTQNGLWKNV